MKEEKQLMHLVRDLLNAIDQNVNALWTDDLSDTIDCIVLNEETFTEGTDGDATEVSFTGVQTHLESIEKLLNQMEEKHDLKTWQVRPDKLKYMGSERYMQKIINFSVDVVATSLQEAHDIVRHKYNLNPYYFTFKPNRHEQNNKSN